MAVHRQSVSQPGELLLSESPIGDFPIGHSALSNRRAVYYAAIIIVRRLLRDLIENWKRLLTCCWRPLLKSMGIRSMGSRKVFKLEELQFAPTISSTSPGETLRYSQTCQTDNRVLPIFGFAMAKARFAYNYPCVTRSVTINRWAIKIV